MCSVPVRVRLLGHVICSQWKQARSHRLLPWRDTWRKVGCDSGRGQRAKEGVRRQEHFKRPSAADRSASLNLGCIGLPQVAQEAPDDVTYTAAISACRRVQCSVGTYLPLAL